jgi:hypothetical protein
MVNNKGALEGWFQAILLSMLFLVAFGVIIAGMNVKYGQDRDASFGASSLGNAEETIQEFESDVDQLEEQLEEGEFGFLDGIIVLGTIGNMVRTIMTGIISFLTGGFIHDIVGLLGLSEGTTSSLALVFRILFVGAIIFLLIKLIFKVKP